jgi:hypothetical protein
VKPEEEKKIAADGEDDDGEEGDEAEKDPAKKKKKKRSKDPYSHLQYRQEEERRCRRSWGCGLRSKSLR